MDWALLRMFEAVARLGSVTAGAQALGVSQSTASRQIAQLEAISKAPLFHRTTPIRMTDRGVALLRAVTPMARAALHVDAVLEDGPELCGTVTLATVSELSRWLLAEALPDFCAWYPDLQLRILADNRTSSLAAGEADVALRLSRPPQGELVARRVHREFYGYYAADHLALHPAVPWLGLGGSLARVPEQRHAERVFQRPPRLLLEDLETLGIAVERGLGVAVLPSLLARRLRGVVAVSFASIGATSDEVPSRDFWAVTHRSSRRVPKVRAVLDWLGRIRGFSATTSVQG